MNEAWTQCVIGDVVEQVKRPESLEPAREYQLLGVRWYAGGPFARETVTSESSKATKLFRLETGDFIYNRLFAWKGSFGVISSTLAGSYVSGEFPAFRTDPERLLPEYLFLYMSLPGVWDQILLESTGSTATSRNRWKEDRFLSLPIELPPVQAQRRIVDLVSSIDTALDSARAWIQTTRRAEGALDQNLVNDASDVERVNLGTIAEVVSGVTKNKRIVSEDFVEIPYLRVANVQRGHLDLTEVASIRVPAATAQAKSLSVGDILFNEGGDRDKLGRGWVWEGQIATCIHQNHVLRARLHSKDYDPYFVSLWGNSAFGRAWFETMGSQTTNLASLNLSTLKKFPVPALPLKAQRRFVVMRLRVLEAVTEAEIFMARLDELRQDLLRDLLSASHEIPDSYDRFLEEAS